MKNNQNGRSMMEMLGVLSVIGVLSVGGFSMVKKMQNSYDSNKVIEEITGFTSKARTIIREYEGTDALNSYLCSAKVYPDGIDCSDGTITGTAGIGYSFVKGITSPVKALFSLTLSGVPEEICMQIATADWGNYASSGFKGIIVGTDTSAQSSYSLGSAASKCTDGVTIMMFYK